MRDRAPAFAAASVAPPCRQRGLRPLQAFRLSVSYFQTSPSWRPAPGKAGVFEAEWLQVKGEAFIVDCPLFRQIEEFPFASALGASVIMAVHLLPASVFLGVSQITWGSGQSR